MVFTVTISLPTKISNRKCGPKHGQDGNFFVNTIPLLSHYLFGLFIKKIEICRFTEFGGAVPYRPAEDLAYSVAKFIQSGGSFVNYYMVSW